MSFQIYQILHVFSVIMLAGITFAALASPQAEKRQFLLMGSGIMALVALVSGFGLLGLGGFGFPGWVVVKLASWLALAALTGMAFRRPLQGRSLTVVAVLAVLLAVGMVVMKPF